MDCETILTYLKSQANPEAVAGMARYGIRPKRPPLGVSIPTLRRLAKQAGKDHKLAGQLWASGIHEARVLASMVEDPDRVTEAQLERWVQALDSWDLCDQCCSNLFDKTQFAPRKAMEWSERSAEFVKRAGFSLMACLAVHDKKAEDGVFERFLDDVEREADDGRNFVKKAVNWALRQIGKRNARLNKSAMACAQRLTERPSMAARRIARDALRELSSAVVQVRLRRGSAGSGRVLW
jgi:3-methyladenine DNA glycosylase AlkD